MPRLTRHQAPNARRNEQRLQDNRSGGAAERLFEQSEDGYERRRRSELVERTYTEELRDGKEPGGDEADGDGTHDGDGDLAFGAVNFFGKVSGTVEAGEGIVGVYQADYECWEGTSVGMKIKEMHSKDCIDRIRDEIGGMMV